MKILYPLLKIEKEKLADWEFSLKNRLAFSDKFFLLAGLRYDTVKQIITDNLESTEIDDTNSNVTPRVGVVYKPIEPVSLYASYSQSFAPNTEDTNSEGEPLEPEEGEGFEVGVKSEFLNGKLFTTLAYFNIDKENVASADPNDPFFISSNRQTIKPGNRTRCCGRNYSWLEYNCLLRLYRWGSVRR